MKNKAGVLFFSIAAAVGIMAWGWLTHAGAAELPMQDAVAGSLGHGFWADFTRAKWDTLMRWANFGILVALFFKYAKTPLVLFIKGIREETARSIHLLEKRKSEVEVKMREGRMELKASQQRLDMIKARILTEGQQRKKQIIDQARLESQRMLASARLKIESQIREASNTIRTELIEKAAEKAAAKLPRMITEDDQVQLVEQWMDAAQK